MKKNYKYLKTSNLSFSVNKYKITKWKKRKGEFISKNEVLLEIEADKSIIEISSPYNGVLVKIYKKVGTILSKKEKLALIKIEKKIEKKKKIKKEKRTKRKVKISNIRKVIMYNMLKSKKEIASATTFNEVNMKNLINLKNKYNLSYEYKVGFMPFFIKSAVEGLKEYPNINSSIEKDKIVYYKYFDINIAISTKNGLIAPIIKNVDKMSIEDIEKSISILIKKSKKNRILLKDLKNGSFTISNTGMFNSFMSIPIINYPQTAILGIHSINNKPIVIKKKIKIMPIMYLSLSYNHCLIDGKEAINFLNTIKNHLENPKT